MREAVQNILYFSNLPFLTVVTHKSDPGFANRGLPHFDFIE